MNIDGSITWIIIALVGLIVIGFALYRRNRSSRQPTDAGKQFLTMGIIWLAIGLAYSIWRDTDLFDIGLFNLGLIFTLAGAIQLAVNRVRKKRI